MDYSPADGFELTINGQAARLLKRCVDQYLERWAGGDPEEQANLQALQLVLMAMVLEDTI